MIRKQQWQCIFLDELQYDRIMLHISKDTEVHQFIRCKIGPLVEYDRAHDTQLLETLEALIQNHNSRKLARNPFFCIEILWYIVSTRSKKCCIAAWMIQK